MAPNRQTPPQTCTFFLRNSCTRGDACRFSHTVQQPSNVAAEATTAIMAAATSLSSTSTSTTNNTPPGRISWAQVALPTQRRRGSTPQAGPSTQHQSGNTTVIAAGAGPNTSTSTATAASRLDRQQPLCKHFVKGGCRYGIRCRFRHDLLEKSRALQLLAVQSTLADPTRPESPTTAGPPPMTPPPGETSRSDNANASGSKKRNQRPCRYHLQGYCAKGEGCLFLHVLSEGGKEVTHDQGPTVRISTKSQPAPDTRSTYDNGPVLRMTRKGPAPAPPPTIFKPAAEGFHLGAWVLYDDGAAVRQFVTPFDTRDVILSDIPPRTTRREIIPLAEAFGLVHVFSMIRHSDDLMSVRLRYLNAEIASSARRGLSGRKFRNGTLTADLDLAGGAFGGGRDGDARLAVTGSNKVRISWREPERSALLHYDERDDRTREALRNAVFDGRRLVVGHWQGPYGNPAHNTLEVRGLPYDVTRARLRAFCQAESVTLQGVGYDLSTFLECVEEDLNLSFDLTSLEFLPMDTHRKTAVVLAHMDTVEEADRIVKERNERAAWVIGAELLQVESVYSFRFSIPLTLFKIVKDQVIALQKRYPECDFRYQERETHEDPTVPAFLFVCAPLKEPTSLCRVKAYLDALLLGDLVVDEEGQPVWDDFFSTDTSAPYVRLVNARTSTFIYCDSRSRTIRVHGSAQGKEWAKEELLGKVASLAALRHFLPFSREQIRPLVHGRFRGMVESHGEGNLELDVVNYEIIIRDAEEEEIQRLRISLEKIPSMLSGPWWMTETNCVMCFGRALSPIILPCRHHYCKACLKHLLCSSINVVPDLTSVKCISEVSWTNSTTTEAIRCNKNIPHGVIQSLLTSQELQNLLHTTFVSYLHKHPDEFRYCPTPECETIYRPRREGIVLRCPSCEVRFCASCHVELHEGILCSEYRKLVADVAKGRGEVKN